jgi:hypothetical protein
MIEYLIRRTDDEWFRFGNYPEVLRPVRIPSKQIQGWGNHRIEIEGEEISFSEEDPGLQVVFETGVLSQERADEILAQICESIESHTGQKTRIVPLTGK